MLYQINHASWAKQQRERKRRGLVILFKWPEDLTEGPVTYNLYSMTYYHHPRDEGLWGTLIQTVLIPRNFPRTLTYYKHLAIGWLVSQLVSLSRYQSADGLSVAESVLEFLGLRNSSASVSQVVGNTDRYMPPNLTSWLWFEIEL